MTGDVDWYSDHALRSREASGSNINTLGNTTLNMNIGSGGTSHSGGVGGGGGSGSAGVFSGMYGGSGVSNGAGSSSGGFRNLLSESEREDDEQMLMRHFAMNRTTSIRRERRPVNSRKKSRRHRERGSRDKNLGDIEEGYES